MASVETNQQPLVQEPLPHQTSPELQIPADMPETRKTEHYQFPDGDLLKQIKEVYNSWPVEKYGGLTLKQALDIYNRGCKKSRLIKDPKVLEEMKSFISQISQERGIKTSKLYFFDFVTGYDIDILIMFGGKGGYKIEILDSIFRKYPNSDTDSHEKRKTLVLEAIDNGDAMCQKRGMKKGQHITRKPKETVVLLTKPLQNTTQIDISPKNGTLTIETCPITSSTFYEKFTSIQELKNEYSMTGIIDGRISLTRAIKLIHPKYKDNEPEPLSFTERYRRKLESWFRKTLPKYGIKDISNIDRLTFFPFLKINPEIGFMFDYQDSDTKLGETTFKLITDYFPNEYFFQIQKLISEFLIRIPLEKRPDSEILKKFLEKCKTSFDNKISETGQKLRIYSTYSEITSEQPDQSNSIPQKPQSTENPYSLSSRKVVESPTLRQINRDTPATPKTPTIPEQPSFIPEILEVKIPKWWTDPKYNCSKLEIAILYKIFSGKRIVNIASEEGITLNQVFSNLDSALKKQYYGDLK